MTLTPPPDPEMTPLLTAALGAPTLDSAVVTLDVQGDLAVFTINAPPVNALSQAVRQGVAEGLGAACATQGVNAILLACAGRTFCAGADSAEFGKPSTEPDLNVGQAALKAQGLTPLARIHNLTVTAGDPVIMLEEPIAATRRAPRRAGMTLDDIDLYEVNEAFAPIPLAWSKMLGADPAKLNVTGGAIALGHPLGAAGAKLMTTLVHVLRCGLRTMCEGGGVANVTLIEAL
jgi:acetyl-CoA C-acetyltransferase